MTAWWKTPSWKPLVQFDFSTLELRVLALMSDQDRKVHLTLNDLEQPVITEAELDAFRLEQQVLKTTLEAVASLKKVVDAKEKDLIARLEAGSQIQGKLNAVIATSEKRLTPWREVARYLWKQLGRDPDVAEQEMKDKTEPTKYKHVAISERQGP